MSEFKPFNDDWLTREGWQQVRNYPYTNANGVVLYQKLRYQRPCKTERNGYEKQFQIVSPNPKGKGYVLGLVGNERVLFQLQHFAQMGTGEPVFVPEGEKSAERLASMNLLATCTATGWNVDVSPLSGRDVFVLRDDDQGGQDKNAERKAQAAAKAVVGIARSVRIVDLPDLPSGGDVVDWLDAGGDRDQLLKICRNTPLYQPETNAKPSGPNGKTNEAVLIFERMSNIEPKAVDWLWSGRIARGKLTLLAGETGMGKSQIGLDTIARITAEADWPDGGRAPSGSALILSAEDSSSDTLRPRLEAAGACLDRVHVLRAAHIEGQRTTFDLAADLRPLGEHVDAIGDVALVLIDPITSYMGRIDSHRTTDVRRVLEPLADFAEKHNVAVVGISHPPKATQTKAIHAVTGSGAFVAAPRLVFIAMEEPESQRSLLLAVKNNLGALAPGLAYRRVQTIVSKGIVASHIVWDTAPVTITANEALAVANNPPPAMGEAIDFLRQELANGPQLQKDLKKSAEAAAISWSTVKRAKKALNVKTSKVGLTEGWQWRLPAEAEEDQATATKEPN